MAPAFWFGRRAEGRHVAATGVNGDKRAGTRRTATLLRCLRRGFALPLVRAFPVATPYVGFFRHASTALRGFSPSAPASTSLCVLSGWTPSV